MSRASAALRKDPVPAKVGRPPRVSVQAIIKAASEIGLENVTLKQVADRLDIGVATLYRHVHSREEMIRLAAFQLMLDRTLPDVKAAHWSELAMRYAESLYETFLTEPQLVSELLKGRLGPHAEVDVLEQFMTAMSRHGFSEQEAMQLFHAIGTVTIGAAAGAIGQSASRQAGLPWSVEMRRTLAERDKDELPRVRRVLPSLLDLETVPWLPTLHALLTGIAESRGERLPTTKIPVAKRGASK